MSLSEGEGGYSCNNCGFEEVVTNKGDLDTLEESLCWNKGDPDCRVCKFSGMFCDYID